ncbi:hypothetical protein QEG73_00565 [Chitinophagaceae bacterium 26-R-25]|nr:hypothetical protein [Chitinophagaceae bacterium 26-R-25]
MRKTFADGFKIYLNNCNDTMFNRLVSNTVSSQQTVNSILRCVPMSEDSLLERMHDNLSANNNLTNKIALCSNMSDSINVYYILMWVFTSKSLNKFVQKKRKETISIEHPTGKVKIRHEAKLSKYANIYLLSDDNGVFKMHDVH